MDLPLLNSNIKVHLAILKRKQADLLRELRKRGIKTDSSRISQYINGLDSTPKSKVVLGEIKKIIEEWYFERNNNT